jgi:heme-degrading monooxygenase HmoA
MQVYQLTIQENGHSRRFVYEDRDEALTRFADAIAAGLDAKLDEVVRSSETPSRKEHTPMQALRIANYKVIKGTFPELADEAKRGMLSTFKAQPGFIRYGLADTGEGTCVSISLWETHAQAEAAAPMAATTSRTASSSARTRPATSPSSRACPEGFKEPIPSRGPPILVDQTPEHVLSCNPRPSRTPGGRRVHAGLGSQVQSPMRPLFRVMVT